MSGITTDKLNTCERQRVLAFKAGAVVPGFLGYMTGRVGDGFGKGAGYTISVGGRRIAIGIVFVMQVAVGIVIIAPYRAFRA